MKNRIVFIALMLMTLLSTQSLFGQDEEKCNLKFGMGVSLYNSGDYSIENEYTNSFYTTLDIGSKFRLEPSIGFVLSDNFKHYSFGIGVFGKKPISKFNLLYGLRLGYGSKETISVAPAIGGEYNFIKNFSIGSEIQLKGLLNEGEWTIYSISSIIVRFYF